MKMNNFLGKFKYRSLLKICMQHRCQSFNLKIKGLDWCHGRIQDLSSSVADLDLEGGGAHENF